MNHNNLFLSIGSAVGSALSAFMGVATQSNFAWLVSIIAGFVAIYAGYLTIKEKRMAIKEMEITIRDKKRGNRS